MALCFGMGLTMKRLRFACQMAPIEFLFNKVIVYTVERCALCIIQALYWINLFPVLPTRRRETSGVFLLSRIKVRLISSGPGLERVTIPFLADRPALLNSRKDAYQRTKRDRPGRKHRSKKPFNNPPLIIFGHF